MRSTILSWFWGLHRIHIFLLTIFFYLIPYFALASESKPEGEWVMQQVNAVEEGEFMTRNILMMTVDRRGKERIRNTRSYRRYFDNGKRTVLFYLSPRNVKGTAFLTYDYVDKERVDDQWLYLPALRKSRRISASERGDYFLGTDFTYDDLKREGKPETSDYHYKTVDETVVNNQVFYVVEALPINLEIARELGYGKIKSWVNAETWMIEKAIYWDIKMNLLKTMRVNDIRTIEGILTRHGVEIENHKTKHYTKFVFSEIDHKTAISEKIFTRQQLNRGVPK